MGGEVQKTTSKKKDKGTVMVMFLEKDIKNVLGSYNDFVLFNGLLYRIDIISFVGFCRKRMLRNNAEAYQQMSNYINKDKPNSVVNDIERFFVPMEILEIYLDFILNVAEELGFMWMFPNDVNSWLDLVDDDLYLFFPATQQAASLSSLWVFVAPPDFIVKKYDFIDTNINGSTCRLKDLYDTEHLFKEFGVLNYVEKFSTHYYFDFAKHRLDANISFFYDKVRHISICL